MNELNNEQISILEHTEHRAAGRRYFGGGKEMDKLVELGLMRHLGKVGWCPDDIYTITITGSAEIERLRGTK